MAVIHRAGTIGETRTYRMLCTVADETNWLNSVVRSARARARRSFAWSPPDPSERELVIPLGTGMTERMWLRKSVVSEVLLAVLVFAASLLESAQPLDPAAPLDWTAGGWIIVNLIASASIVLRRRAPLWVLIGLGVAGCLLIAVGRPPLIAPVVVVLYAVAVYRAIGPAVVGAVALYGTFISVQAATAQLTSSNLTAPVALIIALLLGLSAGNRHKYLAAMVDRAERLTQERDQQARLATAAERARIARELHDVVAHSLSVMIRLSDGAAAVVDVDPARAREAIRQVGTVGRHSLNDMRRMLGVLHNDEGSALAPQPRLDNLDDQVETYRAAGLPVTVDMHGVFPTSGAVQLVVYRAVQEALTNALRYAEHPTVVAVTLASGIEGVTIDVVDDGQGRQVGESEGAQRGIMGLRERAAMYGGIVRAGRRTEPGAHGWSLHMTLPQAKDEQ